MTIAMTEHGPSAVTEPTGSDDACPGCGATTGVLSITGTSPKVQAWSCTACRTNWAISIVNPSPQPFFDRLAVTVEQLGTARSALRQVITLAGDSATLSDEQLRGRLIALADRARGR